MTEREKREEIWTSADGRLHGTLLGEPGKQTLLLDKASQAYLARRNVQLMGRKLSG